MLEACLTLVVVLASELPRHRSVSATVRYRILESLLRSIPGTGVHLGFIYATRSSFLAYFSLKMKGSRVFTHARDAG